MNQTTGKYLILIGILLLIIGIISYFFSDKLGWIGKLPGDIRIKRANGILYIPFTSMILFSVLLNLGIYLLKKFS